MTSEKITGTIGFLGFGNMGKAIAKGIVDSGYLPASKILIKDPGLSEDIRMGLLEKGYQFAEAEAKLFETSSVVVIAVKPQTAKAERENWKTLFASLEGGGKVFISIMAGIKAQFLREIAPRGSAVARVMPNLGLSVGEGATAIATDGLDEESIRLVEAIFNLSGTTARVRESDMDAVTAVSGSGPMYVFEFIEAMTQAGEKVGLSRDAAYRLVRQTVRGSLELLQPFDGVPSSSPDEWSARVRSPGGTTAAAQDLLRENGFRKIIEDAVVAARNRSIELS